MKVFVIVSLIGLKGVYVKRLWAEIDLKVMQLPRYKDQFWIEEITVHNEPYWARRQAGHDEAHKEATGG